MPWPDEQGRWVAGRTCALRFYLFTEPIPRRLPSTVSANSIEKRSLLISLLIFASACAVALFCFLCLARFNWQLDTVAHSN